MNAISILFMLGVIFLAAEFFVPGAVLGVLGGLALAGGVVVAFVTHGVSGGLGAASVAVVLIGVTLFLEFVVLPRTKWGQRMFLTTRIEGTSQPPPADDSIVGKEAEALTPLVPSGYVEIEGRRYDAFSRSGHVQKGEQLRVVAVDNFRVIVSKT